MECASRIASFKSGAKEKANLSNLIDFPSFARAAYGDQINRLAIADKVPHQMHRAGAAVPRCEIA
jgi:hypothetical protein